MTGATPACHEGRSCPVTSGSVVGQLTGVTTVYRVCHRDVLSVVLSFDDATDLQGTGVPQCASSTASSPTGTSVSRSWPSLLSPSADFNTGLLMPAVQM